MRLEFDDGTLLLRNASDDVPYAEWDDRVDEYRAQAYRYRALLEWAGAWTDRDEQATLQDGFAHTIEDAARAYPDLGLTPALHIEPREYQQAALDAWVDHDRRGSVVLPTGSGKTFLGIRTFSGRNCLGMILKRLVFSRCHFRFSARADQYTLSTSMPVWLNAKTGIIPILSVAREPVQKSDFWKI